MDSNYRRTGRTTKLIQDAPMYSIFIWCSADLNIPKKMARELGREDLRVESLSFIRPGSLRGLEQPITLDHHAYDVMEPYQWKEFDEYCCWRDSKATAILNSMGIVTK
jgi:hypothetical protein